MVKTIAEKLPLKRLPRKKRGFDPWLEKRMRCLHYAAGYTARDARTLHATHGHADGNGKRRKNTARHARARHMAHGRGKSHKNTANDL